MRASRRQTGRHDAGGAGHLIVARILILFAIVSSSWVPCAAQTYVELCLSNDEATPPDIMNAAVIVNLDEVRESLGSYGASLGWSPAALEYLSDSGGGQIPFDSAIVNRAEVSAGVLVFADASPTGAPGRVRIIDVTFRVLDQSQAMTTLDISFNSAFAARSFVDLTPVQRIECGALTVPVLDPYGASILALLLLASLALTAHRYRAGRRGG